MSDDIKKEDTEKFLDSDNKRYDDPYWIILLFLMFGFGFGNNENPRINELEKKVARLEGQMSMIGGKSI